MAYKHVEGNLPQLFGCRLERASTDNRKAVWRKSWGSGRCCLLVVSGQGPRPARKQTKCRAALGNHSAWQAEQRKSMTLATRFAAQPAQRVLAKQPSKLRIRPTSVGQAGHASTQGTHPQRDKQEVKGRLAPGATVVWWGQPAGHQQRGERSCNRKVTPRKLRRASGKNSVLAADPRVSPGTRRKLRRASSKNSVLAADPWSGPSPSLRDSAAAGVPTFPISQQPFAKAGPHDLHAASSAAESGLN